MPLGKPILNYSLSCEGILRITDTSASILTITKYIGKNKNVEYFHNVDTIRTAYIGQDSIQGFDIVGHKIASSNDDVTWHYVVVKGTKNKIYYYIDCTKNGRCYNCILN